MRVTPIRVNRLANFGVPGLNADRGPALQPIFANRFRVTFFNFGNPGEQAPYDLTRQMKVINRPKVTWEEQVLHRYVSTVYVVNRGEWGNMTMTLFDDITNAVMSRIEMQKSKQQNFFDQTLSRAGENYKFEMDLDVLAGGASAGGSVSDPNILQKWSYSGCMLTDVDYGQMSYDDQKAMEITCTIRYDNVIGFNQNGLMMGTFRHEPEIEAQQGVFSTGVGAGGGLSVNISGRSIRVSGTTSLDSGAVTIGG